MTMHEFGMKCTTGDQALALRAVDVSAHINGVLTRTVLRQRYRNQSRKNIEITYTFPLPVQGVLLDFAVSIGGHRRQAQVVPRAQAEATYESAVQSGDSAFRLHLVRTGIYVASLGNVMPGEEVTVEVTYAETLPWSGSSLRYRLPATIAPRYGEPVDMQPWERPVTHMQAEYPLTLSVHIEGEYVDGQISSPSHAIAFSVSVHTRVITLASGASMDRDFILEIAGARPHPVGVAASVLDTHVGMVTLLAPSVPIDRYERDTVIVLDCSGSMTGDSLMLAKAGVRAALDALTPGEGFGLIAFGSTTVAFNHAVQPVERRTIALARRFLDEVGELGGTEMALALTRALAMRRGGNTPSPQQRTPVDVLLLTDGQDWNLGETGELAAAQGSRIFPVGIGSAVAEGSLRKLAHHSGGACEFVTPSEDMAVRITRHFARMRQPRLLRIDIAWPQTPLWQVKPAATCFAGDACTLYAAFAAPMDTPVTATFEFVGQPPVTSAVAMAAAAPLDDAIVRMAAMARLPEMLPEARADWAVRHQLVTPETDCVLVVEAVAGRRPDALPELHVVPQMLPAGWHGNSTVVPSVRQAELNIPAFLRRQSGDVATGSHNRQRASRRLVKYQFDAPLSASPIAFDSAQSGPASSDAGGLQRFLGLLSATVPSGLAALRSLGAPVPIIVRLESMRSAGDDEATVVSALCQALIEHFGSVLLDLAFVEAVRATGSTRRDLVVNLLQLLDDLWQAESRNTAAPEREGANIR